MTTNILEEIKKERERQDLRWGGPSHDDKYSMRDFIQWIEDYAGWARMMDSIENYDEERRRLIQVAALAVAAVESLDRKNNKCVFKNCYVAEL